MPLSCSDARAHSNCIPYELCVLCVVQWFSHRVVLLNDTGNAHSKSLYFGRTYSTYLVHVALEVAMASHIEHFDVSETFVMHRGVKEQNTFFYFQNKKKKNKNTIILWTHLSRAHKNHNHSHTRYWYSPTFVGFRPSLILIGCANIWYFLPAFRNNAVLCNDGFDKVGTPRFWCWPLTIFAMAGKSILAKSLQMRMM